MGCEYTLHIRTENITDRDMRSMFSNHLGHPLQNNNFFGRSNEPTDHYERFAETPNFEVGDVSFLKSALTGDENFIGSLTDFIRKLVEPEDHDGYGTIIDDILIEKLNELKKISDDGYYKNSIKFVDIKEQTGCIHIELKENQFLSDVIKINKEDSMICPYCDFTIEFTKDEQLKTEFEMDEHAELNH